jgi:hypothetical protein
MSFGGMRPSISQTMITCRFFSRLGGSIKEWFRLKPSLITCDWSVVEELHDDTIRYVRTCTCLANRLAFNVLGVCLFTTLTIVQQGLLPQRICNGSKPLKLEMKDLRI